MAKIRGEFRALGRRDHTVRQLRVRFLQKIEALTPEVLDDLRTEVQPAFREAVDSTTPAESTHEGSPADEQELAQQLRGEMRTEKAFDVYRLVSESPRVEEARLALRKAEKCIAPRIQPLRRALIEVEKTKDHKEIARLKKRIRRIWKAEISPLEKKYDRVWEEERDGAAKGIGPDAEYHLPDDELAGFARHRDRPSFPDWSFWGFEPTDALLMWARKYHIAEPWLLDVALWTLQCWIAGRELKKFVPLDFLQIPPEPPRQIRFTHPGWHPTSSTWPTYERKVQQAFTEALCEYRDALRKAARDQGPQPGLKKRKLDRHLEWLVLWQVGHWTYRQIAEKYGVGETKQVGTPIRTKNTGITTVRDGLKSAANLIGVTLRKGKRGRPGKSSS